MNEKSLHNQALRFLLLFFGIAASYFLFSFMINVGAESNRATAYFLSLIISFIIGIALNAGHLQYLLKRKGRLKIFKADFALFVTVALFIIYKNIPALMFPYGWLFSNSLTDCLLALVAGYCLIGAFRVKEA